MSVIPSRQDFDTSVESFVTPKGEAAYKMTVILYARAMWEDIHREIVDSIGREVKRHMGQDEEFRAKIREEIKAATLAMPLEAIKEAVKAAIEETGKK